MKMEELSRGYMQNPYILLSCVNMLVFAIELTISAGFSYLPPLLLKAGFGEVAMTWIMGVGSFIALLTVPFLGSWSDNCGSKWGKRTPFMLGISFILVVALIFISFGHLLPTLNVFLLVTGAVLLNYSCQAGLNPCEALLADMTAHTTHQQLGFTIYSVMISFGGCIGYLITAINWSNTPLQWLFLSSERTAFAFVLLLLLFSLATTLAVAVEKPQRRKSDNKTPDKSYFSSETVLNYDDVGYESDGPALQDNLKCRVSACDQSAVNSFTDRCPFRVSHAVKRLHPKKMFHKIYIQAFRCCRLNMIRISILWNGPTRFVKNCALGCRQLIMIPPVLRLLFVADLCCWTALMCQLMFYTDYVGQKVYGGNPNAEEGTVKRELYDDGVRMGSFGLFLHSILSMVYACTIQKYLLRRYGCQFVYIFGLFIYTITMIVTLLSNNIIVLNVMATLSGTGFAAITTVPYMLISEYHAQPQIYFSDHICSKDLVVVTSSEENVERDLLASESSSDVSGEEEEDEDSNKHSRGFGTDIAVMDAAYFLSQTLLSLFIGAVVDMTSVTAYIAIAATFGALSCYCTTKVVFPPHV